MGRGGGGGGRSGGGGGGRSGGGGSNITNSGTLSRSLQSQIDNGTADLPTIRNALQELSQQQRELRAEQAALRSRTAGFQADRAQESRLIAERRLQRSRFTRRDFIQDRARSRRLDEIADIQVRQSISSNALGRALDNIPIEQFLSNRP